MLLSDLDLRRTPSTRYCFSPKDRKENVKSKSAAKMESSYCRRMEVEVDRWIGRSVGREVSSWVGDRVDREVRYVDRYDGRHRGG